MMIARLPPCLGSPAATISLRYRSKLLLCYNIDSFLWIYKPVITRLFVTWAMCHFIFHMTRYASVMLPIHYPNLKGGVNNSYLKCSLRFLNLAAIISWFGINFQGSADFPSQVSGPWRLNWTVKTTVSGQSYYYQLLIKSVRRALTLTRSISSSVWKIEFVNSNQSSNTSGRRIRINKM